MREEEEIHVHHYSNHSLSRLHNQTEQSALCREKKEEQQKHQNQLS
jgi:hypothetical protein